MAGNEEIGQPINLNSEKASSIYSVLLQFGPSNNAAEKTEVDAIKELLTVLDATKKVKINHMETRSKAEQSIDSLDLGFDCLLMVNCGPQEISELQSRLKLNPNLLNLQIFKDNTSNSWIPKHASDLDQCLHLLLKFQPELQTDHPGFHDRQYKQRREEIAQIALNYRHGDPVPTISYTEDEIRTWRTVYEKLKNEHIGKACKEYIDGLKLLEDNCGFSTDNIPQLDTVSRFLEKTSGFRIRPAAGLVSPRDFLSHFAYRIFPCTQYIRHHSRPMHTPEPDCIHELIGHMPILTNREFADFAQLFGLASLGATDEVVKKIATLFWFTIEFGLCRQHGQIKAIGAGLLSSTGEIENAFSDQSEKREFNPVETALQTYDDVGYQPIYYVCQSIGSMKTLLSQYLRSIPRNRLAVYDPITQSIELQTIEGRKKRIVGETINKLQEMGNLDSPLSACGMHITSHY